MIKILKHWIFGKIVDPIAPADPQGINRTIVVAEYLEEFPVNDLEFSDKLEII